MCVCVLLVRPVCGMIQRDILRFSLQSTSRAARARMSEAVCTSIIFLANFPANKPRDFHHHTQILFTKYVQLAHRTLV